MAEYNPSKIIKDGNTYNFRDTTKIPLAGSNEISGSLIPSATDTYNFGSSAAQWNNAYIKSLTINGTAAGDILTHNASEFVDVTSAQTIGGNKTFSSNTTFTSNMVIQGGKKVICNTDNSFIELDGGTTWGKGGSIVLSGQDRSSYTNSVLIVSKSDTNTDILQYQNGELKPHPNNTNNSALGTSTSKWKSFNGLNPGALSLPSNSYINVDTTNWDVAGGTNVYTSPANGWLHIRVVGATELMVRWSGWIFGDRRVSATATDMGVTIPVVAGVTVDVVTVASGFDGKCQFFPCQGNV